MLRSSPRATSLSLNQNGYGPLWSSLRESLLDKNAWALYMLSFVATFCAAVTQANTDSGPADFPPHMALVDSWNTVSYPGWHFVVYLVKTVLHCELPTASSLASAFFAMLAAIAIRWIGRVLLPRSNASTINVLTLGLLFVGPLYFPQIKQAYFAGTGSPNIWHNPTSIAVRPFALACILLYAKLCIDPRGSGAKPTWTLFAVLLLLSVLCKPSFLQIFLPAAVVYNICLLVMSKGASWRLSIISALAFLPSLLPFAITFLKYFGGSTSGSGGVAIMPFAVWHMYTPSVVYSVVCALAFPLLVTCTRVKSILRDPLLALSLIAVAFGIGEYILLAETGENIGNGDFGWGWLTGCMLLWCVSTFRFVDSWHERKDTSIWKKAATYVAIPLFFIHFVGGTYYFISFMTFGTQGLGMLL